MAFSIAFRQVHSADAQFHTTAVDDWERVDALRATGVLDSPPEALYDDLAVLASEICSTPIALVSFVDAERQWFKARVGLAASETHRDVSVCSHAILQRSVFDVPDTSLDERFRASSLVLGNPPMRFCAGAPILEPSGYAFGTVCVIDTVPRQLTSSQLSALSALARQAAGHLELRRRTADADRAKRAAQAEAAMRYQLLRAANDAIVLLSADLQVIEASFSLRPCWDIRWTKPFPCTRGTGMQPSIPDQRFSRAERHPRRRAILSRASGRERTVPGWQSRSAIAMLMGQTDKTCSKRQIGGAER